MKKLFYILLVMTILLSFGACAKEKQNMVTIYIPDTDIQIDTDSSQRTVTYLFEEGWQEKESFRVTYSGDTEILGVGNDAPADIFDGNTIITEIAGVKRSEATYDNHGRQISRVTPFLTEDAAMAKMEFAYTYVLEYDKNYYLVVKATITEGQEVSRTESEYDEHGNWIRSVSYAYGQKTFEQQYTYRAVEVTEETANRLPYFKRGN